MIRRGMFDWKDKVDWVMDSFDRVLDKVPEQTYAVLGVLGFLAVLGIIAYILVWDVIR